MSTPHLNFGTFGRKPSAVLTAACSLAASAGSPLGATSFCRLSEQAQDLIVRAAMGEFNDSPPPEIPESVKGEIAQWVSEPDAENERTLATRASENRRRFLTKL